MFDACVSEELASERCVGKLTTVHHGFYVVTQWIGSVAVLKAEELCMTGRVGGLCVTGRVRGLCVTGRVRGLCVTGRVRGLCVSEYVLTAKCVRKFGYSGCSRTFGQSKSMKSN